MLHFKSNEIFKKLFHKTNIPNYYIPKVLESMHKKTVMGKFHTKKLLNAPENIII